MPQHALLECFPNPYPQRSYLIEHIAEEFTSLCPKTGQPDFGRVELRYVAGKKCVELKSLKFYLQQYRNEGIFYETATNRILDDLVAVLRPRQLTLAAAFTPRGGITTTVTTNYSSSAKPQVVPAFRRCRSSGTSRHPGRSPRSDNRASCPADARPTPMNCRPAR